MRATTFDTFDTDKTLLTGYIYETIFKRENKETCVYLMRTFFYIYSIGRPKHVRVMAGALEGDVFLGPDAEVWLL